jgi:hypothetical protein
MLADCGFVLGKVDAEGLVSGDIAVHPLDVGCQPADGLVGFSAAPLSCSRSNEPTFGISLSMTNLRSAMMASSFSFRRADRRGSEDARGLNFCWLASCRVDRGCAAL